MKITASQQKVLVEVAKFQGGNPLSIFDLQVKMRMTYSDLPAWFK